MAKAHRERKKSKMDAKFWHAFPGNENFDTMKPTLQVVPQMSDRAEKERRSTSSKLITEQAKDRF